jgi:DNA repair exonuclease SbcCD ATPase subunit
MIAYLCNICGAWVIPGVSIDDLADHLADKVAKLKEQAKERDELDQEITTLNVRLQNGRELLEAVRTFWRQKDEAKAAAEKLAKANKEAAFYDALAKALAPEGILSRLIAAALQPMNGLLQVAAVHLFPGRALILNRDLGIELSGAPYAVLSKSEQFRVGMAFQYALAKMAGARLLLIDEADLLDPQNRGGLVGFLLEVQPEFDFILVFAASDHAEPSPVPEIQVWWLEDGKIKPVNQPLAA